MTKLYIGTRNHWDSHVKSIPTDLISVSNRHKVIFLTDEIHYFVDIKDPNPEPKLRGMSFDQVVILEGIAISWLERNKYMLLPCMYKH